MLSTFPPMAEPRPQGPRAQAVIVDRAPFLPARGADALAPALKGDLRDVMSALRLRIMPDSPADAARLAATAASAATVFVFADVPALPPVALEAALEALKEGDVVLGPCNDGGLYLLALDARTQGEVAQEILSCAMAPDALTNLADLLDDAGLSATVIPPWFRLASEKDLSFAESLARLSLLTEEGEDDFVADRLRLWFEEHADA